MGSEFGERKNGSRTRKPQEPRPNRDTKLEFLQKTLLAPFNHKKADSTRILSDCPYFTLVVSLDSAHCS